MRWMPVIVAATCVGGLFGQVGATVYSGTGPNASAIQSAVSDFQNALGPLNAPGPSGNANGRREINWDGVPAQFSSPNELPADFFNKNSVRGAVLSGSDPNLTGFEVSAAAGDGPVRFDNLQAGYSSLFTTFSAPKLFVSKGSPVYDVDFYVPGTDTPGKVSGFGAVFTNVAIPFKTSIEYFTSEGISLGKYYARVYPKGLSFVGVQFASKIVAKVRVTFGTAAPGVAEDLPAGVNIVAGDDFIYGEPANACVVQ